MSGSGGRKKVSIEFEPLFPCYERGLKHQVSALVRFVCLMEGESYNETHLVL